MTRLPLSFPLAAAAALVPSLTEEQRELEPRKSTFARAFDAVAMGTFPWVARVFGYTYRVGWDDELVRDGQTVLRQVWGAKGLLPSPETAAYGERYVPGITWIVAYHRGRPVGVMGLLDMRVGSIACDISRSLPPPQLDLARTREICRLAILPGHRGGAQLVMVGLLREMLKWSVENAIEKLFSGSTQGLFNVYRRFNPTAKLLDPPRDLSVNQARDAYYAKLRAYGAGNDVLYTFEVAGASPWNVFSRFLTRNLKRSEAR